MSTSDPIYVFERRNANERVLCVFNFSNQPAKMRATERWQSLVGNGFDAAVDGQTISLPPFGAFFGSEA